MYPVRVYPIRWKVSSCSNWFRVSIPFRIGHFLNMFTFQKAPGDKRGASVVTFWGINLLFSTTLTQCKH